MTESAVRFVLKARTQEIEDLVLQCARGELPYSGPDSLYAKVHAMGYSCNGLYEMVVAAEEAVKEGRT